MTIIDNQLSRVRVSDVMHTGILTTDATTPLRTVARLMATQRVHAVAIADPDHARRPFGFVSALDVAKVVAGGDDDELTAGQLVLSEVVGVGADQSISDAAQLMVDHSLNHLIVVEASTGHPCGIISSLDIVAAYGN